MQSRYPRISALEAIKQSERQNEIVHVHGSDLMHEGLLSECDDSADAGTDAVGRRITEYWGEGWRVHVHDDQ